MSEIQKEEGCFHKERCYGLFSRSVQNPVRVKSYMANNVIILKYFRNLFYNFLTYCPVKYSAGLQPDRRILWAPCYLNSKRLTDFRRDNNY